MKNIYLTKGEKLSDQYFDAGALFRATLQKEVTKISKKRSKQAKLRRLVAEKTWTNLNSKIEAQEFIHCLTAWCKGARITEIQAMWLLADNLSGCQTFIARYGSGVSLLHTEEDFANIRNRMTIHHTLSFQENGEVSRCLVYNDLMPGAGLYGWKKNLIVAVDSLFLREDKIDDVASPLLVNIVSWMIWKMRSEEASPENITTLIQKLGTLIDGYAINVVRKVDGKTEGFKLTLAREHHVVEYLGDKLGSYSRQVNIIDPKYSKMEWALPPRNLWRGGYKLFKQRLKNIDDHAKQYMEYAQLKLNPAEVESVHTKIQTTIFGELSESFVNIDLGMVCVGLIDQSGTSVSARSNLENAKAELEYVDQL